MIYDNCNSCGGCGGCKPACTKPYFDLHADPYDANYWLWEMGADNGRIKLPKLNETCTSLSTNYTNATLNYKGECESQDITGAQLGELINFGDLRDVDAKDPDACAIPVFNPGCAESTCSPDDQRWKAYTIPDAGDCVLEPDSDGYYKVLKKTDCGCIVECKMPVMPAGMTSLNYIRDSVPEDPDFPWYYGCYNDTINLHLADNAPEYFGEYALKVTVNYGIQAVKPTVAPNYNFRSLVCPVVQGDQVRVTKVASILQNNCTYSASGPDIPWSSVSMRGSFTFVVPKGKEAHLHHEYRIHTTSSFSDIANHRYYRGSWDGQKVPDAEATAVDHMLHPASRLNALQVIIEPTQGYTDYDPVADPIRSQLDAPEDVYPPLD